jgi:hypothetical protein
MPNINVTVEVNEDVDVDIQDILDECSEKDIESIFTWLDENGYFIKIDKPNPLKMLHAEEKFYEDVEKLATLYFRLSKEDNDIINKILSKY